MIFGYQSAQTQGYFQRRRLQSCCFFWVLRVFKKLDYSFIFLTIPTVALFLPKLKSNRDDLLSTGCFPDVLGFFDRKHQEYIIINWDNLPLLCLVYLVYLCTLILAHIHNCGNDNHSALHGHHRKHTGQSTLHSLSTSKPMLIEDLYKVLVYIPDNILGWYQLEHTCK